MISLGKTDRNQRKTKRNVEGNQKNQKNQYVHSLVKPLPSHGWTKIKVPLSKSDLFKEIS